MVSLASVLYTLNFLNLLLKWVKSGSHKVFLGSLKQISFKLKPKYTPHTHGDGFIKIIWSLNVLDFEFESQYYSYTHHRRLNYNNTVWHTNTCFKKNKIMFINEEILKNMNNILIMRSLYGYLVIWRHEGIYPMTWMGRRGRKKHAWISSTCLLYRPTMLMSHWNSETVKQHQLLTACCGILHDRTMNLYKP